MSLVEQARQHIRERRKKRKDQELEDSIQQMEERKKREDEKWGAIIVAAKRQEEMWIKQLQAEIAPLLYIEEMLHGTKHPPVDSVIDKIFPPKREPRPYHHYGPIGRPYKNPGPSRGFLEYSSGRRGTLKGTGR